MSLCSFPAFEKDQSIPPNGRHNFPHVTVSFRCLANIQTMHNYITWPECHLFKRMHILEAKRRSCITCLSFTLATLRDSLPISSLISLARLFCSAVGTSVGKSPMASAIVSTIRAEAVRNASSGIREMPTHSAILICSAVVATLAQRTLGESTKSVLHTRSLLSVWLYRHL